MKTQEEKEAARLAAWQKEQDEIGAEIYDEDLGLTYKDIVEMFMHEYRKLEWYDKDGYKYDSSKMTYYYDSNAPGSFCIEFPYLNEDGEETTNYDDSCHLFDYDDEEYLTMRFSHIQYPTVFIPVNTKTKKEGKDALRDIVIDLRHYKQRLEWKRKINTFLADEE